jgi:hypothetical protein
MIIVLYMAIAIIMAVGSFYFAWRNHDFRKFLAGAFFVSSGILFYLYLADASVPLLGTGFVETPQISGGRSIVHFTLFLFCFYFGFVQEAGREARRAGWGRSRSTVQSAPSSVCFDPCRLDGRPPLLGSGRWSASGVCDSPECTDLQRRVEKTLHVQRFTPPAARMAPGDRALPTWTRSPRRVRPTARSRTSARPIRG